MKILAVDTSTQSGSVALLEENTLIAEWTMGDAGVHARWLMPNLESLLKGAGRSINEVDVFSVTVGPGSFTGLRIGVSSIKGIAWALEKRVLGVSTLEALASNLRYSSMTVCPILDARKGEVYAALFRFVNGKMETVLKDTAIKPGALFKAIRDGGITGETVFLGSGLKICAKEIEESLKGALIAPPPFWHIRASNVAFIASSRITEGGEEPWKAQWLAPVYLRKSEAEIKSERLL